MNQIVSSDLDKPELVVSVLRKTLDGGFEPSKNLNDEQQDLCRDVDWIEAAIKFKCSCGDWHPASEREGAYECPIHMRPVEPDEVREGFRRTAEFSIDLGLDIDYRLEITENTSATGVFESDDKCIIFAPNVEGLEFPDRVGRVVWLPIESLPRIADEEMREEILTEIRDKRKNLIDWERLDKQGNTFEELTYRLVARQDEFYNRSWGGQGPDQGKDGYCSVDTGGSGTRVLIQAKGNPGSSLNKHDIRGMVQDADSHDCDGLLLTAVNISGDVETKYESNGFRTAAVPYVKIWPGVEIKEKLSRHPDLIAEYFIN